MKRNILRGITAAALLAAASCDIVEDDQLPVVQRDLDLYVAPFKSATIDVKTIIPDLLSLSLSTERSNVLAFGNRWVQYSLDGTTSDNFRFEAASPTSRISTNVKISPFSADGACDQSGSFDYARITTNSALVVNLFNNSEFCGLDLFKSQGISVASGMPGDVDVNTEGVNLAIFAGGSLGSTAILTYVPPAGFVGQVRFVYRLGVFSSGNPDPDIFDPADYNYYSIHEAVIDVVAE